MDAAILGPASNAAPKSGGFLPGQFVREGLAACRATLGHRGVLLTVGLATLALSAGAVAWARQSRKLQVTQVEEEEEEERKEDRERATSWSDLVEEEEAAALEMQSTSTTRRYHSGSLDEEILSTTLEHLSLEKHESKKIKSNLGSSLAMEPTSNSGMVSPRQSATACTTHPRSASGSQCSDETGDSNFDAASAHSMALCGDGGGGCPRDAAGVENQTTLSDSGQGSEADDGIVMAYHFNIPNYLCGKLIGVGGTSVTRLKAESNCRVTLQQHGKNKNQRWNNKIPEDPHDLQLCQIEGTRFAIDKCLELLRVRFPIDSYPDLTLDQVNLPEDNSYLGEAATSPQLGLIQGITHEVVVSAIVSAGQIFIQQPTHPTFFALKRLTQCMQHVYSEMTPSVPRPLERGLICAACVQGVWYRVQILTYDSVSDSCDVKFLDHGGYERLTMLDLRQIRSDFLELPFQAIECYLSNIIPSDESQWSIESNLVLEELTSNKVCHGQMIGYAQDCIPMILLYIPVTSGTEARAEQVLVNRELVERGVAAWIEHSELTTTAQA